MKSVKEISEELEVSKQTVFNNIKRLNIETVKQDNTSFIKNDVDVEKIIQRVIRNKKKYGFESANVSSEKVKTDNKKNESKYDVQIIELLEKQIDTLNKQLEKQEKRHETTIEFYRKELQERSKLLENQQVLALESNKKIQRLESELEEERQLNYSANKRQDIEVQETMENMDSINNDSDSQKRKKMVSHFRDESKDKHEDKQQDSELQQGNKIDGEQKEDIRNENHSKKSFWSKLFGN
jgi:acetolactate synthase regulatory subunit